MEAHMPIKRFNILAAATTGVAAFLISTPALAGDPALDAAPTIADYFNGADSSGDAALNGAEFRVFVDTLADSGHEDAIGVRASGDYDAAFLKADSNADGIVTYLEVNSDDGSADYDVDMAIPEPAPVWVPPVADELEPEWEDGSDDMDNVDDMPPEG